MQNLSVYNGILYILQFLGFLAFCRQQDSFAANFLRIAICESCSMIFDAVFKNIWRQTSIISTKTNRPHYCLASKICQAITFMLVTQKNCLI